MDYEWVEDAPVVESQSYYSGGGNRQGNRGANSFSNERQGGRFSRDRDSNRDFKNNWRSKDNYKNGESGQYFQHTDDQRVTIKVPSRFVGRIIGNLSSEIWST